MGLVNFRCLDGHKADQGCGRGIMTAKDMGLWLQVVIDSWNLRKKQKRRQAAKSQAGVIKPPAGQPRPGCVKAKNSLGAYLELVFSGPPVYF